MPPMSLTARIGKTLLDRETDARFWAQTGYKVGQKLDQKNPADKAMIKTWLDIFAKVKRENDAGKLVLTYNKPGVEKHLADAEAAQHTAAEHIEAAATAPDDASAAVHAVAAQQAIASSTESAQTAAAMQPPTVSHELAHASATEATQAMGTAPPAPIAVSDDHPANGAAGRPSRPIEFFLAMDAQPGAAYGATEGSAPGDVDPIDAASAPAVAELVSPAPPTAHDHVAVAVASQAHEHAAKVHEIHADPRVPAPSGALPPATIAQIRDDARARASADPSAFVGVAIMPDGTTTLEPLPSREALDGWYGTLTDHPDAFTYAAAYDKHDPSVANGEALYEVFGSGQAIPVTVHVDQGEAPPVPPPQVVTKTTTNLGPAIAAGGLLTAMIGAIIANRTKTNKRGGRL